MRDRSESQGQPLVGLGVQSDGLPIARVAAKIAIGLHLDEIENAVTQKTTACFEPALDYCVVKFPRWPFDKFQTADRMLGTQMKATGEVMADRPDLRRGAALRRSARSKSACIALRTSEAAESVDARVRRRLAKPTTSGSLRWRRRCAAGIGVDEIHEITKIDRWFLREDRRGSCELEARLAAKRGDPWDDAALRELVGEAKETASPMRVWRELLGTERRAFERPGKRRASSPVYKMVDTCAAEFEAATPYYYSTYGTEDERRDESAAQGAGARLGPDPHRPRRRV